MKKSFRVSVTFMLLFANGLASQQYRFKGIIVDRDTHKPLSNVNVLIKDTSIGITTDVNGEFAVDSNEKQVDLIISRVGYERIIVAINTDTLNVIYLKPKVISLEGVNVVAGKNDSSLSNFGINSLALRNISTPLPDPMLALKTLPGISSQNDQTSLFNVRGGNFDENLLYINGFEIYQPTIVRKGSLENPSLINPLLVKNIEINTGVFPVNDGDKLSSVLNIEYYNNWNKKLSIQGKASTTGFNLSLFSEINKNLTLNMAFRDIDYRHIKSVLNEKSYLTPVYRDFQSIISFHPNQKFYVEALLIFAKSDFKVQPKNWLYQGYFSEDLQISYSNSREEYGFNTKLLGIKLLYEINAKHSIGVYSNLFKQDEKDVSILHEIFKVTSGEAVLDESLINESDNNKFVGNYFNNKLDYNLKFDENKAIHAGIQSYTYDIQYFAAGYQKTIQWNGFEYIHPSDTYNKLKDISNKTYSGYIQFENNYQNRIDFILGLRKSIVSYSKEQFFMPRINVSYKIDLQNSIAFGYGYFIQPPVYKEYIHTDQANQLKSQRMNAFTMDYRRDVNSDKFLKIQTYYKKYHDLISYDVKDIQLTYSGKNDGIGYAYGMDFYLYWKNPYSDNNWVSYSYLVAKEKLTGQSDYVPRPTDRRHQISLYTEGKMSKWQNSKMFVRVLYGSGFPYTYVYYVKNIETNQIELHQGPRNGNRYPFYGRADLGFRQTFKIKSLWEIELNEEILNLFDHVNVIGYDFMIDNQIIKKFMTCRVLTLGCEIKFN